MSEGGFKALATAWLLVLAVTSVLELWWWFAAVLLGPPALVCVGALLVGLIDRVERRRWQRRASARLSQDRDDFRLAMHARFDLPAARR